MEIYGFGSFALNYRPLRIGRNSKTGELVLSAREIRAIFQGQEKAQGTGNQGGGDCP